jgi:hypothetical protein
MTSVNSIKKQTETFKKTWTLKWMLFSCHLLYSDNVNFPCDEMAALGFCWEGAVQAVVQLRSVVFGRDLQGLLPRHDGELSSQADTREIESSIKEGLSGCKIGILHLFIQHTSAALTINENYSRFPQQKPTFPDI